MDDWKGPISIIATILAFTLLYVLGVFTPKQYTAYLKPEATETEQRKPEDHPKFEALEARGNDQEARVLRNSLLTGAQLIRTYREDDREISRLEVGLEFAHEERDEDNISKSEQALQAARERKRLTYRMYQQELLDLQRGYTGQQLRSGLSLLDAALAGNGSPASLAQFAGLFVSQAEAFRQTSGTDEETIGQKLIDFKVKQ